MPREITGAVVAEYLECHRKGIVLLLEAPPQATCEYCTVIEEKAHAMRAQHVADQAFIREHRGQAAYGLAWQNLHAQCDLLCGGEDAIRPYPLNFIGTHQVPKAQEVRLAFFGYVHGLVTGSPMKYGTIVNAGGRHIRVALPRLYGQIKGAISELSVTDAPGASLPPVAWSHRCACCVFGDSCRSIAEASGSLSLLAGMTAGLAGRWVRRGVDTIDKLSCMYRPRRRKKRRNPKAKSTHNPSLQALAIREKKILVDYPPEPLKAGNCLILDIEGDPDEQAYYLIGLLAIVGEAQQYHGFWADDPGKEGRIWRDFTAEAAKMPGVPIYCYGSYDIKAVRSMMERHGGSTGGLVDRMVNVNSLIYGRIYFPTYGNGLKEICGVLGAKWSNSGVSGLRALAWWHKWRTTGIESYRSLLLQYNSEDCTALSGLVHFLGGVTSPHARQDVDYLDRPRLHSSPEGSEAHRLFDAMVRHAHADYQERRITTKHHSPSGIPEDLEAGDAGMVEWRAYNPRPNKTIVVLPRRKCPNCGHPKPHPTRRMASLVITDLRFSDQGCRKIVTRYSGPKVFCSRCHNYFNPPVIAAFGKRTRYGQGFMSWAIHQRVAFRLPYSAIAQSAAEIFNIHVPKATLPRFVDYYAGMHSRTERKSIAALLRSPFIHVDETPISIQGTNWYVWVFTDGLHVVFRLTETRECDVVHQMLSEYEGVLVTDFYGGYDSAKCKQQKCLVHVIGDINDDLWKEPYDKELEGFALGVRDLLSPIFADLERYGNKSRHLRKHVRGVERFYGRFVDQREYKSEVVTKYQKRFDRYRESMFRFLLEDGIPWNNNMAERGIRHIAVQRKISGSFGRKTTPHYLRLLGIAQSCRFQDKSFLKFLLSGKKDVDEYVEPKRRYRVKLRRAPSRRVITPGEQYRGV